MKDRLRLLSGPQAKAFCICLWLELTIAGRSIWSDETLDRDVQLTALKWLNEIQHRLTRFIEQILADGPARPTNEVMIRLLLAPRAEKTIEDLMHAAWSRTIQTAA